MRSASLRRYSTVSIHASAREATMRRQRRDAGSSLFRSTPPRGRRPRRQGQVRQMRHVSIHASAREATLLSIISAVEGEVSIHASAREATRPAMSPHRYGGCFDPRLRAGGDPRPCRDMPWLRQFRSTPPRGRRRETMIAPAGMRAFRSTPPRGRRRNCLRYQRPPWWFRSTPPRGRRLPRFVYR